MTEIKGGDVARPEAVSTLQRVAIPAGHRMVWVTGERSRTLEGDCDPPTGAALPGLLKDRWTVEYVLPVAGGTSFYFFLAPPAGPPEQPAAE